MVTFLEGTFNLFFHVVAEGLEGGGRDWGIRGIITDQYKMIKL